MLRLETPFGIIGDWVGAEHFGGQKLSVLIVAHPNGDVVHGRNLRIDHHQGILALRLFTAVSHPSKL